MPSHGEAFRDRGALERAAYGRRRRPKQLHLGAAFVRRSITCVACARQLPSGATGCPDCGAFVCRTCDEITSVNGGDGDRCFECLVHGKAGAAE